LEILTVGDVVNISMAIGDTSYQPAAGIEIIVLMNYTGSVTFYFGHTDGVQDTSAYCPAGTTMVNYINPTFGNKAGFTNARYYYNTSTNAKKGFSGIQIR